MCVLFGFVFLQLLPNGFTQQNLCCISKSTMEHQIEQWTSLYIVMLIGSVHLLSAQLNTQVFPTVFTIECRVVINIRTHSPISFQHVSIWCLLFDPYCPPTHTGVDHQRTVSTNISCNQWLSLAKTLLKVALVPLLLRRFTPSVILWVILRFNFDARESYNFKDTLTLAFSSYIRASSVLLVRAPSKPNPIF